MHDFIVTTIVLKLASTWQKESGETSDSNHSSTEDLPFNYFLNDHGLKSMSLTTTWRWMRLLGFQYDTRKKSFYVDGHERGDVVATRSTFCKRYLTEFEPFCQRWVQLSVTEAKSIDGIEIEFGYLHHDIVNNKDMLEFHVDYWLEPDDST